MLGSDNTIELFHGYTYSGHPAACAAGMAALDIYTSEGLFTRGLELSQYWQDSMFSLKGRPGVIDIRTIGLVAGIELEPRVNAPGTRGYDIFVDCFERGLLIRVTGDIIALSPPLIVQRDEIDLMVSIIRSALDRIA